MQLLYFFVFLFCTFVCYVKQERKSELRDFLLLIKNVNLSSNKKAFTLTGKLSKNSLICEQLNYNYLAKEGNKSKRLYGTVKHS